MADGPRKTRYDTNPLDPKVAERAEAEMGSAEEADSEGPTRPMDQIPAVDRDPYATDPAVGGPTQRRYVPPAASGPFSQQQPPPQNWSVGPAPGPIQPLTGQYPPPPQRTSQFGLKLNFAAMLCYMPFIGIIIAILLRQSEPKQSGFVRFHAQQALFAHIAFWIVSLAFNIAGAASPTVVKYMLMVPQFLFFIASMVGFVVLMSKAYHWQMTKIPIIGDQVE